MNDESWDDVKQQVHERAHGCCEYCQTSHLNTGQTMQVDHIHPAGGDGLDNLCLACWNCNNHKRNAVEGVDPDSGARVRLFNPRSQVMVTAFRMDKWRIDNTRFERHGTHNCVSVKDESGCDYCGTRTMGIVAIIHQQNTGDTITGSTNIDTGWSFLYKPIGCVKYIYASSAFFRRQNKSCSLE